MDASYSNFHPNGTPGRSQRCCAVTKLGRIELRLPGRKNLKVSESQHNQLCVFSVYIHEVTTFLPQPLQALLIPESQNSIISMQPRPMNSCLQNKLLRQFRPKSEPRTQTQPEQAPIFQEPSPCVLCHQTIHRGTTPRVLHEDKL